MCPAQQPIYPICSITLIDYFETSNPKTLQFRFRQPVERLWLSIGRRTNDNIYDRRAILHRQGFLQRILQFRNLLNKVALVPEHAQHSLIACFYSQS